MFERYLPTNPIGDKKSFCSFVICFEQVFFFNLACFEPQKNVPCIINEFQRILVDKKSNFSILKIIIAAGLFFCV